MKQDECLFDNTLLLKKNFPAKCEDHFSHSDVHLHLHVSNIYLQICQKAVRETIGHTSPTRPNYTVSKVN